MNDKQLVGLLGQAGFRGKALRTAFGVAKKESGGRRDAHNPNAATGDDSYGLFQINMLGAMGPERRKLYGLKSNEDLFDPLTNAKIAFRMSGGGKNWEPWTTYTSGAYKEAADSAPVGPPQRDKRAKATMLDLPDIVGKRDKPGFDLEMPDIGGRLFAGGDLFGKGAEGLFSGTDLISDYEPLVPGPPKPIAEARARKFGGTTLDMGPAPVKNPKLAKAIEIAKKQIGTPYVWGASSPKVGFDCSGLIEYCFEAAGIRTPGRLYTGTMANLGKKVSFENIEPGDWIVRHSGSSGHVVMYVGNGQVIAAPQTGELVQYQPLSRFKDGRYSVRRWHG